MDPYDDLEGVAQLTGLPDDAWHRDVDKLVLAAGSDIVKTAIVCPPTIYGPGRGTIRKRSSQLPGLVKATLENGKALQLGKGKSEWNNVHVHDLSALFVLLAEAAVAYDPSNKEDQKSREIWGGRGYFLAENGHHVWGEISKEVSEAAYKAGYIKSPDVVPMSAQQARETAGLRALTWGLNSKGFARRAKKYLGWKPVGQSLKDSIPELVESEARALGLTAGQVN